MSALAKRVIPCLDVADGRVVKGVRFVDLCDAGDPVEVSSLYDDEGADELALLDITASHENRGTLLDTVTAVAGEITVPLTVGGGVRTVEDFSTLLRSGADKVSINSAAVARPELISECAERFGAQCVVVAVDAKRTAENRWTVHTHGGRRDTGDDAVEWAARAAELGAGEILLTSMDRDGTCDGFDIELTRATAEATPVPVIASGGAGGAAHLAEAIELGGADAVLAAGIFHRGETTIGAVKSFMAARGIEVNV